MNTSSDSEVERWDAVQWYWSSDPAVEAALLEACRLATVMFGCPGAAVEIAGRGQVWVRAAVGLEAGLRARPGSLADRLLGTGEVVWVEDTRLDPRFSDLAEVQGEGGVRSLASACLMSPEGLRLGSFRIWDHRPRAAIAGQSESLAGLGRLVLAQLNLQRRQRELETLEQRHAQVEARLTDAEAQYRGMFENIVVGIYQTTPEGRYKAANPMLAEIYGYASTAALIEDIGDIEHQLYVDPRDRDRFKEALGRSDRISNFEAQIRRKDGRIIWIVENARVVRGPKGEVLFYEGTVQDITDRKAAEKQLLDAEQLYHSLVEELPQSVFRKDRGERFIFANQRFCETAGRTRDQLLGRTDFDFFPADLARKYQADDQRVMAEGRTVRVTERNVGADGSVHWVEVIKSPLRDGQGETIGIQGIFWDVTDTKRLQDELAFERDLLRALLDHSPDIIYFKDAQSRFVKAGKALAERFGVRDPEELVGKTAADFLAPQVARAIHEEEQELLRTGRRLINRVEELIDVQGVSTWVSVTKIPIYNRGGESLGLVGVARDITKLIETERRLRDAEEKYRAMVVNSVEGIYQTSPEGRFISVNPALVRIYRYASREELEARVTDVGRQVYVKPGRRDEFTEAVLAAGSVTGFESEVRCGDGTTTWVSESARCVRDRDGQLQYFEGTVEDISGRKLIEAEREKTRQAALDSAKQQAEFLATVSHEIRTPLNAIVPNAAMLSETSLDPHQRSLVESIDAGARMLLQIVNDVLDFARVEAGGMRLEEIDFDLFEVVERSLGAFAGLAQQKQLELIGEFRPGVPRHLRGDPQRLAQVLNNLLGNALKFTSAGEVALAVEGGEDGGCDDLVEIRFLVRDTGIGIAPEAKSRVFQAFAQADGSMSRRFGGTGLGLAITRRYVEAMGGAIDFDSEVGVGTTFRFSIRAARTEMAGVGAAGDGTLPLSGQRVLVLDDNVTQLRVLAEAIAAIGAASVRTASDLASALDQLRVSSVARQPVDLIFFDPSVSNRGVKQLASELRSRAGACRLIAVAPPGLGAHDRSLEAHGILGFIVKPLRRSRLSAEIAALLTGRRIGSTAPEPGAATASADAPGRGLRILLVEDNPLNQRVAVQLLERLDATVEAVADGALALRAYQERTYDLILMDCQMPGMDGYETTARIRQLEAASLASAPPGGGLARIPIVALSANAFTDDRERGLAAGMDDYLTKPLSQLDLARVLRNLRQAKAPGEGANGGKPEVPPSGPPVSASVVEVRTDNSEVRPTAGADSGSDDDAPVLDPTPLLALAVPDDPSVLREFVEQFLAEAPTRIGKIAAGADARDGGRVRSEAHALKGNASYMGARRMVEACTAIEAAGRAGETGTFGPGVERLRSEFEAAKQALVGYLKDDASRSDA